MAAFLEREVQAEGANRLTDLESNDDLEERKRLE